MQKLENDGFAGKVMHFGLFCRVIPMEVNVLFG